MTSIVLAGGRGLRLGRGGKLSETIGGRTLPQRVIDCLIPLSSEILVVIAQGQPEPALAGPVVRVVTDLYPGKGALGGIYTGLVASSSFHNLVVACDMPFLNSLLLGYMIQLSPGFDVIIPRVEAKLEPLHAIYSRDCLTPIRQQIEQGNLKISNLLERVKVRYVEEGEINRFDPKHLSFFNINTRTDLEMAKAKIEKSKTG